VRSIKADQYEFDDPGSEESLEIDLSRQENFPHPGVSEFVASVVGVAASSSLGEPVPFYRRGHRSQVTDYLKRFANVDVATHADWPTYELEKESWDQVHLVICAPGMFIRYQWSTSA
jgi:hypothetical protein